MGEGSDETLVIRQSRLKHLLILLGAAAFLPVGVMMINDPDGLTYPYRPAAWLHFWGWAGIVMGGLGGLIALLRVFRPSTIRLSSEGFAIEHWPTKRMIRWSSVESFSVWKQRATRLAAWRLHADAAEHGVLTGINASFGIHGTASGGWEETPEAIVSILRAWKKRHAPEPGDELDTADNAPKPRW